MGLSFAIFNITFFLSAEKSSDVCYVKSHVVLWKNNGWKTSMKLQTFQTTYLLMQKEELRWHFLEYMHWYKFDASMVDIALNMTVKFWNGVNRYFNSDRKLCQKRFTWRISHRALNCNPIKAFWYLYIIDIKCKKY